MSALEGKKFSQKRKARRAEGKRFNQTENNFICCGDIKIRKTETRTNRSLSSQLDKTQARVSKRKKSRLNTNKIQAIILFPEMKT